MIAEDEYQTDFFDFSPQQGTSIDQNALWEKFKNNELCIDLNGTVKIKKPFCYHCGRKLYTLDGFSLKMTYDILGEKFYFVCQKYICKCCNNHFSAYVKNVIVYDEEMVNEKVIVRLNNNISKVEINNDEMYNPGDDILSLMDEIINSHIQFEMSSQAHYNEKDVMDLAIRNSINAGFMETTRNLLDVDPNFIEYPSADTVLLYIKKKKFQDIKLEFRTIFQQLIQKYRKCGMINEPVDIAVDFHDEEYYGKQRTGEVIKGKGKNGTNYFHKYITVDSVNKDKRFTLAGEHISQFDDRFKICNDLLDFIDYNKVKIQNAYLDREFFNHKVTDYLIKNNIPFVIPAVKNDKVKKISKEKWNQGNYVFTYYFGKGKNKSKDFTIFLVPNPDYDPSKDAREKNHEFYLFATNIEIKKSDYCAETTINNNKTGGNERKDIAELYKSRWGIETDYRVLVHEFLAKTTSNKFHIRFFNFMMGVVLRNIRILSQILFKEAYGNKFPKNILTAKLWKRIVERTLNRKSTIHSLKSLFKKIGDGARAMNPVKPVD